MAFEAVNVDKQVGQRCIRSNLLCWGVAKIRPSQQGVLPISLFGVPLSSTKIIDLRHQGKWTQVRTQNVVSRVLLMTLM